MQDCDIGQAKRDETRLQVYAHFRTKREVRRAKLGMCKPVLPSVNFRPGVSEKSQSLVLFSLQPRRVLAPWSGVDTAKGCKPCHALNGEGEMREAWQWTKRVQKREQIADGG